MNKNELELKMGGGIPSPQVSGPAAVLYALYQRRCPEESDQIEAFRKEFAESLVTKTLVERITVQAAQEMSGGRYVSVPVLDCLLVNDFEGLRGIVQVPTQGKKGDRVMNMDAFDESINGYVEDVPQEDGTTVETEVLGYIDHCRVRFLPKEELVPA